MDAARAQQLENWHQQREIQAKKQQQRYMTEQFDQQQQNGEADWRTLAKFGVDRNQVCAPIVVLLFFVMDDILGECVVSYVAH